jgi:alginate O-acetyltransferase complex protein AlgI
LSFTSLKFLIFIFITVLIYYKLPHKFRWILLLAASYIFYLGFNPEYAVFLAASTLITYFSGLLIYQTRWVPEPAKAKSRKKLWAALSILVSIGILTVFKYLNFLGGAFAGLLTLSGISTAAPNFDLLLPVGLSYYIFQSLSYTIDVYRGDVEPEFNLGKYALYVSFFPTLVAGPIQKSKEMLHQFNEAHYFNYEKVKKSTLLIFWGYFEKMVVADRLGILVDTVYKSPSAHSGLDSILAVFFYSFQIYCDFAGYSNIAVGIAEMLGFRIAANFNRPYFARNIQDFWRRWHISLSTWFRDYLYIPLGGNRCSKVRRCLNVIAVFAVCGLWHGASVTFLVWGLLHGIYQVFGIVTKPLRQKIRGGLKINDQSGLYWALQTVATFLFVSFAWIFFRANTIQDAFIMIGNVFRLNLSSFLNGSVYQLGLNQPEFWTAVAGIFVVLAVDLVTRKIDIYRFLSEKNLPVRWLAYTTAAFLLILFGEYGSNYTAQQFIYYNF